MATTQLRPTATWQSLGAGPFDVQVLTGAIVVQAADRCPATADISGTIIASVVGAPPTHLYASEWWVKALVTETVTTVTPKVATAVDASAGAIAAVSASLDGTGFAGIDLAAALIVVLAADGTLRPASSSDPNQFGLVAGFTLLPVLRGGQTSLTRRDAITSTAWSLTPGPVFVGQNGGVTQVEPTVGFVQVAGLAVSATTIVADFWPPILL